MSPRRSFGKRLVDRVLRGLDAAVPADGTILLHSVPDLDDNIVAVIERFPEDADFRVLARHPSAAKRRARQLGLGSVRIVKRRSPAGVWRYLRSSTTVTTHGLFGFAPRRAPKSSVGLWHGELGKQIGQFISEGARYFDWVPVSSHLSRMIRAAEFGLDPHRIHVVGSPRQSTLQRRATRPALDRMRKEGEQWLVWVPTYRQSVLRDLRVDGDPSQATITAGPELADLRSLLESYGARLWIRPHPLASQDIQIGLCDFVCSATNASLQEMGATFYDLLARSDCLITDYSSVWVDYLLLDKPIIGACFDLRSYRVHRGLALEPYEAWFPGPLAESPEQLIEELRLVLSGDDRCRQHRQFISRLLVDEGLDYVESLLHVLGMTEGGAVRH